MKRLTNLYLLIAFSAVSVFVYLALVDLAERGAYAASVESSETSTAAVMAVWYGSDQALEQAGATIVSDDFNSCSLDTDLWTFTDTVGDAIQTMTGTFTLDAWLVISVPSGTKHDIWKDGNSAPRSMQPADDTDFEIEVKFESGLSKAYQMQGVLVEQDDDDFLRFEFHSDGSGTNLFAASFEPGSTEPLSPSVEYNQQITGTNAAPLYMRVGRQEDEWTQSYSFDGANWTTPVTFTHALTVTAVGTYAANAGDIPPSHAGYIDYFFNAASRIDPEDGDRNTLTVRTVGSGQVVTEPVKSTYDCGEVVTLTATADLGWTFAGWGGDLSGTDESVTVTMTGGRVVTATFTQDEYTLAVDTVGSGRVITEPVKPTYHYGDVVTFTADADPGWTFEGWSGDLSGTDVVTTKTISAHTTVTATFTQDEYTLTVDTAGEGEVEKDPDQEMYHYGDTVTLTATAASGWRFARWSDDLSSTDNPVTATITGDTSVTAIFTTREEYTLTVHVKGKGSVTANPDQTAYHYGDEITLTAQADPGWTFTGWSGDLTSTDNPETIMITGNTTITATFDHQVFLPLVIAQR